jgi:hypothetical protein
MKNKRPTPKIKKEIADVIKILDSEKDILKRIENAKRQAEVLLAAGYIVEGYELVEKFGNRTWVKGTDTNSLFARFKKWIPKKGLYTESKLLSPAKLEKYFVEVPEAKEDLKSFYECKSKGLGLAKS